MGRLDVVLIAQFDETVERLEGLHQYDLEQLDDVLAHLDRLHAELSGH